MKPRTVSVFGAAISFVALSLSLAGCGGGNPAGPAPPASIAGTYAVTITASAGCAAQLRTCGQRVTLTGDMTQSGAEVWLSLRGDLYRTSTLVRTSGTTVSMRIRFVDVESRICPSPPSESGYDIEGDFNGTTSGRTISGTMNGRIDSGGRCNAAHTVVFAKQ